MTWQKTAARLVPLLWLLAGCGTDPIAQESRSQLPKLQATGAMVSGVFAKSKPTTIDPAAVSAVRQALVKAGQPVLLVKAPSLGYANLFMPNGQNGDVVTWASSTQQSVALRDGILTATRGFGTDLMSAHVPALAQVQRGSGNFGRDYYDLDGADQSRRLSYVCTFKQAGEQTIDVFGASYATRKVIEVCHSPNLSFENDYWFDADGSLRQSTQHVSPDLPVLQNARIVD